MTKNGQPLPYTTMEPVMVMGECEHLRLASADGLRHRHPLAVGTFRASSAFPRHLPVTTRNTRVIRAVQVVPRRLIGCVGGWLLQDTIRSPHIVSSVIVSSDGSSLGIVCLTLMMKEEAESPRLPRRYLGGLRGSIGITIGKCSLLPTLYSGNSDESSYIGDPGEKEETSAERWER
ncbi:hypothetical protein J6590_016882 [Homalodisca vitripennis]|nr:hypothetical protein J6590_016882 [Homalodisca vitripennis]